MTDNRWQPLLKRVRAMHTLWQRALTDMTAAQVNHHERPGVLPIGFSIYHFVEGEDRAISDYILSAPTIWADGGWAEKTGIASASIRRGTPLAIAEQVRVTDLDGWRVYQSAVFARTESALAALPAERWAEVLHERTPETMKGGFIGHLAGDGPVILGDLMDVFIYQHGMRHLGEIEHARSLVGLGGVS